MAVTKEQVTELYVATFNRAPDASGLNHWVKSGLTIEQIAADFFNQPETRATYPEGTTDEGFVTSIYLNVFNREPDAAGLAFWVGDGGLGGGIPRSEMILAVINGAQNNDAEILANKTEVGLYYAELGLGGNGPFHLTDVTEDDATVDAAKADIMQLAFTLTDGQDDLTGSNGDDVFFAPIMQSSTGFGNVTNTFDSGDILDGGEGNDALYAELTQVVTGTQVVGPAIQATTDSIEEVYLQAQFQNDEARGQTIETWFDAWQLQLGLDDDSFNREDFYGDFYLEWQDVEFWQEIRDDFGGSTIDAGKMNGMKQLWSKESRSDILVEDVRTRPEDMTIGMDGTDPWVSYIVEFDSNMFGPRTASESSLTYQFVNQEDPASEMADFPVDGIRFEYEGENYDLTDGLGDADTFDEFGAALEGVLADAGLDNLTVEQTEFIDSEGNVGVQYVINDPDGGTFVDPGVNFNEEELSGSGELFWNSFLGEPVVEELPVETNVVLDNVGRMDQGGVLDIGGMSNKGVNVFNVEVVSSSWLAGMYSTSNAVDPDTGSIHHLETVNISHAEGGEGDLVLGTQLWYPQTDVNPTDLPTGYRVAANGLMDVQTFNAEGFEGAINLGASFTDEIFGRYLDDAEDTVQFEYLGGDGGNLFTFQIDSDVAADPDFALDIVGGDANDRFNLAGDDFDLKNISLDGGDGEDIVEVWTSIGTTAANTPAAFDNIETLILAGGDGDSVDADLLTQDEDVELDVDTLIIATDDGTDSTITNLDADETTVTISGKNQTLFDSNADQDFGEIVFEETVGDSLTINIVNTGRVDSDLSIDWLEVAENEDGTAPEEIVLNSTATRDRQQVNTVLEFVAPASTDLLIEGDTDFNILISDFASAVGAGDDDDPLTVDAQNAGNDDVGALVGDLTVAMDAGLLTNGSDDELIGAEGENDVLAFYSAGSGMNSDATISGFETIQFGWTYDSDLADLFDTGSMDFDDDIVFDAENTSGVEEYVIGLRGGGNSLTLDNLENGANVVLGDDSGVAVLFGANPIILNADAGGALNLEMTDVVGSNNPADVQVNGFTTINLDVASTFGTGLDVDRELDLLLDAAARTLNITGGDEDEDVSLTLLLDIPATVSTIDVSEYAGAFTGSMSDREGTDTTIVVGNEDLDFTLTPDGGELIEATHSEIAFDYTQFVSDMSPYDGVEITLTVNGDTQTVGTYDFNSDPGAFSQLGTDLSGFPVGDTTVGVVLSGGVPAALTFVNTDSDDLDAPELESFLASTGVFSKEYFSESDYSQGQDGELPVDYNTIFEFTDDGTAADPSIWVIDNFITANLDDGTGVSNPNADVDNFSILDLSGLGIESYAELDIDESGSDLVITEETANPTWQITLVGVDFENAIGVSENFEFAV